MEQVIEALIEALINRFPVPWSIGKREPMFICPPDDVRPICNHEPLYPHERR